HPNSSKLLSLITDLLNEVQVIDFDAACAARFGEVRGTLLQQGIMVSRMDLLIASVALVHNLTLVTHNTADYRNVPGLRLDGRIGHAEIKIGDSPVMLADEYPEMNVRGPLTLGGASSSILIYVADVDARFQQAIAAGATVARPVKDQFYGDRSGTVTDPFGHMWTIATHD